MGNIGEKINHLRKARGLSQEELGFELGVARQTISKWEKNLMQPTTENIKALCDYFDVKPDYFFSDKIKVANNVKTETAVTAEPNEPSLPKNNHNTILIVLIILVSIVLVISLIFGTIFTYIFYQPPKGDDQVMTLDVDWGGIISFCIAIAAFITLVILLIYYKVNKKK